ncbi:MAG: radical SAM protein [Fidelibacterota bacterium]|nr:MAG: radical SAM protein [Candidatus Neomarinimicrobiota bacterium]
MVTYLSRKMLQHSFAGTVYHFQKVPPLSYRGRFGVYVHIPFCRSKCSFCPFYKEIYSEEACSGFMEAVVREIEECDVQGVAKWIYFGGGTPNTLPVHDIVRIKSAVGNKMTVEAVGIELLPALIQRNYLQELKANGFTKVSIGIESFGHHILQATGRTLTKNDHPQEMVAFARSIGLWVNVDLMVGLPAQSGATFLEDIRKAGVVRPDQITIYPFMVIRGLHTPAGIPSRRQFRLIEQAGELLAANGYERKNIWTFARGQDLYDS